MKRNLYKVFIICLCIITHLGASAQFIKGCDQTFNTSTTTTVAASAAGDTICFTNNSSITVSSINLNNHSDVVFLVENGTTLDVTLPNFTSENGFKIISQGTTNLANAPSLNTTQDHVFRAEFGGEINFETAWAINDNSIEIRTVNNSTINFLDNFSIQGDENNDRATITNDNGSKMTVNGDFTLNGKVNFQSLDSFTVTGNFKLQNGNNNFLADCNESVVDVGGEIEFTSGAGQVLVSVGIIKARDIVINTGSNNFKVQEGARLIFDRGFANNNANPIDYTGIAGGCSRVEHTGAETVNYSINQNITDESEIIWCAPEPSPLSRLGSATNESGGCVTTCTPVTTTCNPPLQSNLQEFYAYADSDTKVSLHWSTFSEEKTALFNVEKSFNGINFNIIDQIAAYGGEGIRTDYSYTDNNIGSSTVYYRIVEINEDESKSYSDIKSVTIQSKELNFHAAPNPTTTGKINIQVNKSDGEIVNFMVYDILGKEVLSLHDVSNQFEIDLSPYAMGAGGMFIAKIISSENQAKVKKLIVR